MDEKSIKEALQKGERVLHAPQAGKGADALFIGILSPCHP